MKKDIYEKVWDRADGVCEICESNYMLELHHAISGRGKRKQHECIETCFLLCYECHRSKDGVHGMNGHELNKTLKLIAQERLVEKGYTEDEVRKKMGGKLYSGQVPSRRKRASF